MPQVQMDELNQLNLGAKGEPMHVDKKDEDDGMEYNQQPRHSEESGLYRTLAFQPQRVNFENYWLKVRDVIDAVMSAKPCSRKLWDNCFFDIYALGTTQCVPKFYANLTDHFVDLVSELKAKVEQEQGIDFMEAYASAWLNYKNGVKHVHDLCGYVNRMIKKDAEWKVFEQDYPELYGLLNGQSAHFSEVARIIWREYLLKPLKDRLFSVIWAEFSNTRNSDYALYPNTSVKVALESFIDVCFPSDDDREVLAKAIESAAFANTKAPSSEKLNFYEEFFEEKFLRETDEHFKRTISQEFFSDLSRMFDYMTKAKKILENEERLCRQFLFGPTVEKTLKLQRIAFVLYQLDRFAEVVPQYVRSESKKELNLAYGLLSPFSEGVNLLVREYEKYVRDVLHNQLKSRGMIAVNFVEIVCSKFNYYKAFTDEVFEQSHALSNGFRRAIESVVNDDRENEKFFAAKMIARHMDQLLRKSTKTSRNSDIEEKMEEAVTVFRFVKDKDAFLKIYQRMFSTRLLGKFISSMELESLMIEKLRNACGHDYTNKLVRMYTDYDNSRSLTEEFKTSGCKCEHHPEDEFTIIQTCAWPVTCSKDEQHMNSFIIPKWLLSTTECFKKFYEAKYNGRVLNYAYHVSTADIGVNVGARKCVATMTVPQAVLLLSFESNDELAIGKISEAIGLTFETTCNCLKALIDFKILQVQPPRSQYTPESVVAVNLEFQAQRSRVHLPPPTINTRVQESASAPIQRETIQDRKVAVECAIVRAMKTNKVMKHGDLINVVIEITKQRFIPEVSFVKQTIEGLIDKHFIQRSNNLDEYEYLS